MSKTSKFEPKKKLYRKPTLAKLGSAAELTQAKAGRRQDGAGKPSSRGIRDIFNKGE